MVSAAAPVLSLSTRSMCAKIRAAAGTNAIGVGQPAAAGVVEEGS